MHRVYRTASFIRNVDSTPVALTAVDPMDITPSVADVGALLRARTKDINGDEVGTFNDDTRPTSAQVITLIDEAVGDITTRMGPSPPLELAGAGKSAAAMLTACLIELSYYPEQVCSDRSGRTRTSRPRSPSCLTARPDCTADCTAPRAMPVSIRFAVMYYI